MNCPHCNSERLRKKGLQNDKQRYACRDCHRQFQVPLEASGKVPDGYVVKGQSILYDEQGNVKLKWEKVDRKAEKLAEAAKALLDGIKSNITPQTPQKHIKKPYNKDLSNLYVITDYHIGMASFKELSGADWNMEIAEQTLVKWFEQAIRLSPNAQQGVLANIGDFLHYDYGGVTPHSGHVLDIDGTLDDMIKITIRVFRKVIQMLLEKHKEVHILMCDANHDPASEAWLRQVFDALYSDEPRVIVNTTQDTYYCHEFGKTSLFFHHGHRRKVGNIDTVFAAKYRDVFGRTKHSYAHMGHLHSVDVKETNLMLVEQHRTLAAADEYATKGGWVSGRDAKCITYHKEYGEVGRLTISYNMIS
jgi:hypothetical protein